ncbi:S1 family peptidase [Amycolatopsis magusensis]|uniref:V8-like Glu-specific endopeptidase n=1 Tax=Amycolatopsis magusensis TaxID=882444 RepID=A0ABS4PIL7_9PSEU|nr:serine protease [Amycolatopsis magusensis]MBP2179266.1 V8-like Glu-specific endopeptidase [Amycolatopsis magusensis]MDI5981549.1 serine protease [Amycolatopsis magusensis]
MIRRLLGATFAATAGFALVSALPAAASTAVDFAGAVALSNCSGSVVKTATAAADDPALVLTNGHCLEEGFPDAGEVLVDQPSTRTFSLLSADGSGAVGQLRANRLEYATMTGTDAALYRLDVSYTQIEQSYGISALELAERPSAGTPISVVSGYWQKIYRCSVDGFVHELREGDWTWRDSIRYTPECQTIGGTSGSPIVDAGSGKVVGVNNTGNESGGECTMNNPCEVDEQGNVTVRQGINYGQQTHHIPACVGEGSRVDLNRPGCELPKPGFSLLRP